MSKTHPFRFGHFSNSASRTEWTETARKVEAAAFSTLVVGDHFVGGFSPFTALVMAAAVTTTLRLCTFVLANDLYKPVVLARDAASLDVLSDGRLELGLGTGFYAPDYLQAGIPLEPPRERVNRFEEALQIITGALTQRPFNFTGRYYTVRDLEGLPRPIQQPRPPIIVGGSAKRMLSLAARTADIVSVNIKHTAEGSRDMSSLTAAAAAQKIAWVPAAAGERIDELELNILAVYVKVTDHPRQAIEEMITLTENFTVDDALESPSVLVGSVDKIVETLIERRQRYGFSYIVTWAPVEEFAPVVARLAGR